MFKLRDFLHLPQLDSLMEQLVRDGQGMVVLAGIESRQDLSPNPDEAITPSGLSALFNILLQEIMLANPHMQALVISEGKSLARVPRAIKRRVQLLQVEPPYTYEQQIEQAIFQRPGLLVIDRLSAENARAAFRAAQRGIRVLTQLDSVLHGAAVMRQVLDLGIARNELPALHWILTMQRIPALCTRCRRPAQPSQEQIERLCARYPHLRDALNELLEKPAAFNRAGGCGDCRSSGFSGSIALFDLFRNDPDRESPFDQPSLLALEEYALRIAAEGELDLDDLLNLESNHLRQVYQMLTASERALSESNSALSRKLFELEASNRVLVQRTEALISLQDLGQALISSTELRDLASRICRRAGDLCGADHVILYLRRKSGRPDGEAGEPSAEVLAVRGWEESLVGKQVNPEQVFGLGIESRLTYYMDPPPGVNWPLPAPEGSPAPNIQIGLRVPLVTQDQQVGVMIVQSMQKTAFLPGETALLRTFANQAALAIQRAGLVDELKAKITQLEAAQAELVKKERLDRELELAREVQQSMLPQHFPDVPGFAISARNEPARQVGGDFYDMFLLDDDHFGLVIADVADKGMPAALYMALTRSLLLAEARRESSPAAVLANVNRLLLELGEMDGFVSICYGVVERSTRRLTYTRAGHMRPMLLREGKARFLPGDGITLGILEPAALEEMQTTLQTGDLLVFYTDGLTDVVNEQNSFMGLDGLKELAERQAHLPAEAFCQAIFDALAAYRGSAEQFDDMTLLVAEIVNP